ncbi:hypothetical protein FQA39_LY18785 [Lamprigera yunnana]|nr:hypothetical protein FQA39_LY18785 [Lamprigera yunnana]
MRLAVPSILTFNSNSAISYAGEVAQLLNWNVAGTTSKRNKHGQCRYPLVAMTTEIHGYLLAAKHYANDGSQAITILMAAYYIGKNMVKGTNHIFFDVNNGKISVILRSGRMILTQIYTNGQMESELMNTLAPLLENVSNFDIGHLFGATGGGGDAGYGYGTSSQQEVTLLLRLLKTAGRNIQNHGVPTDSPVKDIFHNDDYFEEKEETMGDANKS